MSTIIRSTEFGKLQAEVVKGSVSIQDDERKIEVVLFFHRPASDQLMERRAMGALRAYATSFSELMAQYGRTSEIMVMS